MLKVCNDAPKAAQSQTAEAEKIMAVFLSALPGRFPREVIVAFRELCSKVNKSGGRDFFWIHLLLLGFTFDDEECLFMFGCRR